MFLVFPSSVKNIPKMPERSRMACLSQVSAAVSSLGRRLVVSNKWKHVCGFVLQSSAQLNRNMFFFPSPFPSFVQNFVFLLQTRKIQKNDRQTRGQQVCYAPPITLDFVPFSVLIFPVSRSSGREILKKCRHYSFYSSLFIPRHFLPPSRPFFFS